MTNIVKYDTIYKRTSTGKIQIWFMEILDNMYRTTSGQFDGKKTTTEWTVATPKNIGKVNETNPEQQAVIEVLAEYDKKLARDYLRDISSVDVQMRFKPMLATKWEDRKDKITQDQVIVQPKLDGMRCIINKDGMWSREGKPIVSVPHIFENIEHLFVENPELIFDGELYNHNLKDDFNKLISICKKQKPTKEELEISRHNIQYWMYDLPSNNKDYFQRYTELEKILSNLNPDIFVLTYCEEIYLDKIGENLSDALEDGFEGIMIRLPGKYENKRSNTLVKYKLFQDEEFKIVDIQEGDGNRSGMAARVILELPCGKTFGAGLIGNVEFCRDFFLYKERFIGKMGTVIFQNYTPDGVPRFPKFKYVRSGNE
jgi:DNA ligase-1